MHVKTWNKIIRGLKLFKRVSVARHVLCKCRNSKIELFDFFDSLWKAYCACIYVLKRCSHGTMVPLLTSKCRLVPLKSFTIPRIELLAFVSLSKLLVSVLETLKQEVKVTAMFCWSDSVVALRWMKEVHKRWGVWVQNRVEVIRGNTSTDIWFHVSSTSNLLDISTCSISLDHLDFVHCFHGPQFLFDHQENWPSNELVSSVETKLEEQRADLAVNMVSTACHGIGEVLHCHDYSSFKKLLRVTSYILRFKANILSKLRKKPAIFTTAELNTTELE